MSEIITFPLPDGANYVIPDVGDENWGQNVTDFLVAIPAGVLPRSGTFTLTGDVSFGPTFGLVSNYFKSFTLSPASAGFIRLSKTDAIEWRNNANSADLPLAINGSDQLTFNGTPLISTTGNLTDTGTDGIVVTGGTGALISSASLAQHVADASHNGYLAAADWSTFNGKQAALTFGNLTDAGTDGIVVTNGTGAVIGSGTSIAQHVADTTHSGYLSSTDWNTFNGKGAGTVSSVALTVPTFLSVSGSPITSSGTFAISLSGTALPVANGGTGDTSFTAYSVLCGGTTSTGPLQNVSGVGTTGQLLQSNGAGALPTWATIATGSGTVTAGTAGQFAYYASSSAVVSGTTNLSFTTTPTIAFTLPSLIVREGYNSGTGLFEFRDTTNNIPFIGYLYSGGTSTLVFGPSLTGVQCDPALNIAASTNQLQLGNTGGTTVTITAPAPASSSTYTVPDVGPTADFILSAGTQTIGGSKTFSSAVAMGSNKITGLANGTAAADAVAFSQILGFRILQVVSASTSTTTTSTSTTYADATNLTVTITPTLATSTVWIIASVACKAVQAAATQTVVGLRIVRGASTVVNTYEAALGVGGGGAVADSAFGQQLLFTPDSPATTSATTYKVQLNSGNATATASVNDGAYPTKSYIYAIEVG